DHVRAEGGELGRVEHRRHHAALLSPQLAAAGEQPLAGQRIEREADHQRLLEGASALDEERVDRVGGVEEDRLGTEDAQAPDSIDLVGGAIEERQDGVATKLANVTDEGTRAGNNRDGVDRRGHAPMLYGASALVQVVASGA